ncbi:MAG TPA: superoxide dismutase [Opitutaceae bacterium]
MFGADAVLPTGSGATKQPFVLPPLGYGFDALEPHIDALTMQIHYSKHHAAYIKNANKALEGHPLLANMTAEEILVNLPSLDEPLRATLRNNVGGHVNHSFFWTQLSPKGGGAPSGDLAAAITAEFGSVDAFKTKFTEASMKRFGSGWAWLSVKGGKLAVHSTANQDSPLSDGAAPVVGLDVWEHAYYLKHQNVRADYVSAFWTVIDWDQAGRNYAAALAKA